MRCRVLLCDFQKTKTPSLSSEGLWYIEFYLVVTFFKFYCHWFTHPIELLIGIRQFFFGFVPCVEMKFIFLCFVSLLPGRLQALSCSGGLPPPGFFDEYYQH